VFDVEEETATGKAVVDDDGYDDYDFNDEDDDVDDDD